MKTLIALCCLAGLAGWISAAPKFVQAFEPPKEIPVTVLATPDSLNHAKKVCENYRERTGGIVGHVDVYSLGGEWSALPCSVILEEK